jgi:hypothetical protein
MDWAMFLIIAIFLLFPSVIGEQLAYVKRAYDRKLTELKARDKIGKA